MASSDAMIAVMGATGTGKSSFIQLITGDENIRVGHGQESQTDHINVSRYFDETEHRFVTFIDTPGFDDSRDISNVDILQEIADFLANKFSGGQELRLSGVIYMHRISDPRMGGTAKKNLRMFRKLCGDGALKNVVITTTNWNRVTPEEGARRESELRQSENFFKPLIDAGAQLARHDSERASAQSITSHLLNGTPVPLQIQDEIMDGKNLGETSAGSVLTEYMETLEKKHRKELQDLRAELEAAARAKDEALQQELKLEREEVEAKMAKAEEDRARLAKAVIKAKQGALEKFFGETGEGLSKCAEAGEKVGGTAGGITLVAIGIFPSAVSAAVRAVL